MASTGDRWMGQHKETGSFREKRSPHPETRRTAAVRETE